MAYDIGTGERYNVVFDEIESSLRMNLLDFQYQNEWINGWMNVLKKAEQYTDAQIQYIEQNNISFYKPFRETLEFNSFTFCFGFSIPRANRFIKDSKPNIITILLKDICNGSFGLKWTPTIDDWKSYVYNDEPVMFTDFPAHANKYLLIDGNHRLTAKASTKQDRIKSFYIPCHEIINYRVLPMKIDETMYRLFLDAHNISNLIQENKYTHRQIFDDSFIHSSFIDISKQ